MPTYEYRCRDCGRDFEVFRRMSDRQGVPCPGCGRPAERLISGGAGFLFRGDGFYITDHRSEDYRRKAREEAGGGGEGKAADKPGGDAARARSGESGPANGGQAGAADRKGDGEGVSRTGGKRPTESARGRRRGERDPAGSGPGPEDASKGGGA